MDEFNEKDHLDRDAEDYSPIPPETPVPSELDDQPAPESQIPEIPAAPEATEVLSAREEEATAPRENAGVPTENPAGESAYWSSRSRQQSAPPPYQQPRNPYQQQPYYSGQQNSYPPHGGYGYGRQNPYGQNQGYPPGQQGMHGGYQQYGTSSGWQQPPPPPQQDHYDWRQFEDYDNLEAGPRREKKRRNRGMVVFTVALVVFLCVGLVGLSVYTVYMAASVAEEDEMVVSSEEAAETSRQELPESELEITARTDYNESLPVGGKMTIPQVAETVLPSVAGVFNYRNDQMMEPSELGSGIVMNTDGYIITNAHVVAGGTGYRVQIHEGEIYDAILVGEDEMSDLAVLKIEAEGLVPAQFGDSDTIKVGETVVAIGNPAGLSLAGSVTGGIISAVNRSVQQDRNNMDYIQTDAAINPGNSGGALANEYGQVIGINSSKIVAAGYEGIGFAIPISEAKPIIDELIANGRVTSRAMLGIEGLTVDAVGAREYGERGILIGSFNGNEDLPRNGAQVGDIITHVDGERIYTLADLRRILDTKQAGDSVTLTLYRRLLNQETNFDVETRLVGSDGGVEE